MNSLMDIFYFFFIFMIGVSLLLSVLGLWFTAIMPGIDRWSKKFFVSYFIVLMLCCLSSFIEVILYYSPVSSSAIYFSMVIESLFLSLACLMLTFYLLHCCGENMRSSKLLHSVLWLLAVYFCLNLTALFVDDFCYAGEGVLPRVFVPAFAAANDRNHAA